MTVLQRLREETRGGILPILAATIVALIAGGVLMFSIGRATASRAGAQTAADAAALAAVDNVRAQLRALVAQGRLEEFEFLRIGESAARAAAADYAARNDARLVSFRLRTATKLTATVEVVSNETVGDDAGRATATAELTILGAGGGGGGGSGSVGACPIPRAQLEALAGRHDITMVHDNSALLVNTRCDGPGVAVAPLTDTMKVGILMVEEELGRGIRLSSAYRSPGYQTTLCARLRSQGITVPCALSGRSMHNVGMAIDAPSGEYQNIAAALSTNRSIPLCWPIPGPDPYHFVSVEPGSACGGRQGTPGLGGGPFTGGPALTFEIRLIE